MGRFRSAAEDNDDTAIDISPLMDCVFILLIFFIVTTTFVEETGVEVNKPSAASASNLEKTSILLAITAGGEVMYGGRNIGLGGVQSEVKRLIQKEDIPVIIQADKDARTELLMRVLDSCNLAGATKISLASAANKG